MTDELLGFRYDKINARTVADFEVSTSARSFTKMSSAMANFLARARQAGRTARAEDADAFTPSQAGPPKRARATNEKVSRACMH